MDAVANFGFSSLQSMKGLCQMLRNNADRILSGEMSITITSDTLYQLNEAVDNLQDGLSPPNLSLDVGGNGQPRTNRVMDLEEWNLYLQLVLDIVSKAPVLVLYRDKNSRETCSTSNSQSESPSLGARPVRLGYFTSLNHLEINHVPIKSIQDLLKMRERLETLVVMNCTDRNFHLQDVLEMCDQEISVPMQWAVLTHLCLRCNHLMELDGSLRLCPRLEMLDLSRNRLPTTDVYLGYLMELTYVDLSYNCLSALPSFSATAKKKLKILLLAGNKIMDLTGIEEMTSLQQLDISENLICTHHCLFPVRSLHRLDVLNMRGCPASMVNNHRLLALQYISSVSLSRQFCLDRRQVTHKEIQNSRAVMSHSDHHHRRHHSARPSPAGQRMEDGVSHMARNFEERPSTAESLAVGVTSSRKKKSRKKAKARTMDIQDMDSATGGDLSSRDVTPSTTPKAPSRMEALAQLRRAELQETRTEMEHLRRYYGDSWLQAVEDKGILHPSSIINATDATAGGRSQTSRKSETESAVKENATAEVEVHSGGKAAEKSVRGRKVEGGPAAAGLEGGQRSGVTGQETGERAFNKESMFLSSESGAEDGGTNDLSTHTGDNTRTQEDHGNEAGPLREAEEVKNDGKFSAQGQPSPDSTIIEPEDQSDPFIVTLPDQSDCPFLITVSTRYLVEKDINAVMQDKLDLQSLESVRVEVEEAVYKEDTGDTDNQQVKVILEFSSIRKDRRSRAYIMEDFVTAQHFRELVQPFIDAKTEAAMRKLQVQYQCLKCNSQFKRGEAATVVHSGVIPHTGSIKDFASMAGRGGEKVSLRCPKCQSDHIIQMEEGADTPLSSSLPSAGDRPAPFTHSHSTHQLMSTQSPKAHSTPVKQHSNSDIQSPRSLERKGSRSGAPRSLFAAEDQDRQRTGEGPITASPVRRGSGTQVKQQEGDNLPKFRQRSNAFYDQPPVEARQRSNAVVSPAEFLERRTSGSIVSNSSDVERTRNSASSSFVSTESPRQSHLATFAALNNLQSAGSSVSSELTPAKIVSSVESDIAVLQKRDSLGSVVVLSSSLSGKDVSSKHSSPLQQDTASVAEQEPRSTVPTDEDSGNSVAEGTHVRSSGKLTPVQQEAESVEVTPMGSPLSSSICSSMVSSVYHNSLLPDNSVSSYVTASENSIRGGGGEQEEEDHEISIYDQAESSLKSMSSHKVSVSSEVEVLSVEEELSQTWLHQDKEYLSSDSLTFATDGGETTTTTIITNTSSETGHDGDDDDDHTDSNAAAAAAESIVGEETGDGTGYNFRRLDHRLALHLMMNVFDNNEEFKFKCETCVCQYMMPEEYDALVAITNLKIYVLRINTQDTSVELTESMKLMEAQPLAELRRVGVGLGGQTLRLEFTGDCSSYTLVARDAEKVCLFSELLSEQLQTYGMETGVPMSVVFDENADQTTLDTLSADVLTRGGQDEALRLYILAYIARGHNPHYPIAIVVSTSEVCLVKTNHQWPSPQHQAPVTMETVGKQFTVLERQKINNIATVAIHSDNRRLLCVTFFNETTGDETQWIVTMETDKGVKDMVDALREPWEEAFGVDMDVELCEFDTGF